MYSTWFLQISLNSKLIFKQHTRFSVFYIIKYKSDSFLNVLKCEMDSVRMTFRIYQKQIYRLYYNFTQKTYCPT